MKVGTVIGFTIGVSLAYFLATKWRGNIKEQGKQMIKEKIDQILS